MKGFSLRSSKAYLTLSIATAVLAAVTLLASLNHMRSRIAESGKLTTLVVAAKDVEAGEVLDLPSISTTDFPDRYILPGMFTDPLEVTGRTLRHPLKAGEPLLDSSLLSVNGEGLIQNRLETGYRAYPLPSTSVSFPSSALSAGSRVDVLTISEGEALVLLEGIEVLGIKGSAIMPYAVQDVYSSGSGSSDNCILLQLTAEEACRLAAADEGGKVEIMLRPSPRG